MKGFICRERVTTLILILLFTMFFVCLFSTEVYGEGPRVKIEAVDRQDMETFIETDPASVKSEDEKYQYKCKYEVKKSKKEIKQQADEKIEKGEIEILKVAYDKATKKLKRIDRLEQIKRDVPIGNILQASCNKAKKIIRAKNERKNSKKQKRKIIDGIMPVYCVEPPCSSETLRRLKDDKISYVAKNQERNKSTKVNRIMRASKVLNRKALNKVKKLTKLKETVF